jgi:hypothetical protein
MEKAFWQSIADAEYALPTGHDRLVLTAELVAYLGSPDPELRDTFAYEILGTWVEDGGYQPDQLRDLAATMAANLQAGLGEQGTDSVFRRSFSALILGHIVSVDNRIQPFLTEAEVHQILDQALAYLVGERDLRGYVAERGWAHSAAHTADLLWVLGRSRHLGVTDLTRLLDAIADKISAPVAHVYLYGEDERLVRPVLGILERNLLDAAAWTAWVGRLAQPPGRPPGKEKYADPAATAARHNTRSLVRSLYFKLAEAETPPPLAATLQAQLRAAQRTISG